MAKDNHTDLPQKIDVFANLHCESENFAVSVQACGNDLHVKVASCEKSMRVATLMRFLRANRKLLNTIRDQLSDESIDTTISVSEIEIARIGKHSRPNLLGRFIGIGAMELKLGPLIQVLVQQRRTELSPQKKAAGGISALSTSEPKGTSGD